MTRGHERVRAKSRLGNKTQYNKMILKICQHLSSAVSGQSHHIQDIASGFSFPLVPTTDYPHPESLLPELTQKILNFTLQLQKGLLIMPRNDSASRRSLEPLQPLRTLEPSRMISRQPALRNAVSPLHPLRQLICSNYKNRGSVNLHFQ